MRSQIRLIVVACVLAIPMGAGSKNSPPQTSPCGVIDNALSDYQQIKTGITRKDVEKYFELDGGLQFPSNTRYVYPKCRYLHLDIEFEMKGTADHLFSPDDKVVKASRLYVEYPVKD